MRDRDYSVWSMVPHQLAASFSRAIGQRTGLAIFLPKTKKLVVPKEQAGLDGNLNSELNFTKFHMTLRFRFGSDVPQSPVLAIRFRDFRLNLVLSVALASRTRKKLQTWKSVPLR